LPIARWYDARLIVLHVVPPFTDTCHWRTTPSTTNTFATRYRTFQQDIAIHRRFSLGRKITADHEKFCCLGKKGAILISSIPGWSTHADLGNESPLFKEALCTPSH
jgi:hypothetical protein